MSVPFSGHGSAWGVGCAAESLICEARVAAAAVPRKARRERSEIFI
jgi:hypothetical protein